MCSCLLLSHKGMQGCACLFRRRKADLRSLSHFMHNELPQIVGSPLVAGQINCVPRGHLKIFVIDVQEFNMTSRCPWLGSLQCRAGPPTSAERGGVCGRAASGSGSGYKGTSDALSEIAMLLKAAHEQTYPPPSWVTGHSCICPTNTLVRHGL